MPDNDYVIRARITFDASTYESDIQGAVAANKAASDQMQADFAAATAVYRQKLAELTKQQNDYVKANVKLTDPAAAQVLSVFAREVQAARDEVTVLAAKMVGLDISTEQASKGFQLTDEQLKSIARSAELAGRQLITLADIERAAAKEGTTLSDLKVLENQAKQEVAIARSQQRSAQTTLGPSVNESPIAKAGLAQSNTELTRAESTLSVVAQKQIALTEAETAAARPAEALAEAQALITRQDETLAAVQAELAGSINTTAAAINSQYIVANKEATVATTAFIKVSTELGAAVKAGNTEAIQAVALLRAHYQQLLGVVEELAAREELMARAEAQSTEATLAEARAQVNNTISTEGSAVAALRLANAKREATNAAEKQAAAIISANSSIARSEVALDNLQAEVAANVGASASEMVAYVERAKAEIQNATSNLKSSQIVLGASQTAESKEAIASLTNTMIRAQGVLEAFSQKLATLRAQSNQQADAADVFKSSTDKQAEAIANVASATTELEQRFKAMKALIVSTAGADFPTLDAALVRVRTDLKETQTALMQAQSALSSLGLGSREATAQLAATQATWIAMTAAGNDFIASVSAAKDAQQAENDVIAATAEANTQAIAITERRAAVENEVATASGITSEKIQEHAARAMKVAQDAAKAHAQAAKIVSDAHKTAGSAIKSSVDEAVAALQKLDGAARSAAVTAKETAAFAKLLEITEKAAADGAIKDAEAEARRQVELNGSASAALRAVIETRAYADALGNVGTKAAIARGGISELEGSTQGVVFAFSRIAAASKTLAPFIEAAFPVIGAVAFVDILVQVVSKVKNVYDALRGLDDFAKQMFQDQWERVQKTGDFYVQLADKIERIKTIGLSGTVKSNQEVVADQKELLSLQQQSILREKELHDLRVEATRLSALKVTTSRAITEAKPVTPADIGIKEGDTSKPVTIRLHLDSTQATDKMNEVSKALGELQDKAKLKAEVPPPPPSLVQRTRGEISDIGHIAGAEVDLKTVESRIKKLTDDQDTTIKRIQDLVQAGIPTHVAEGADAAFKQSVQLEEQTVERSKQISETLAEIHKKSAQEDFTAKKITIDQENKVLNDAAREQYDAEKKALDQRDALRARLAAKGSPYDPKAREEEEKIAFLKFEEEKKSIAITTARQREEELKRIQEQQLKDLETRVSTVTAEAPEGEEKRTELQALQTELQKVRETSVSVGAIAIPNNLKEYEYLIKRIPIVTKEAAKESEKEIKEATEQMYENWVESGNRSAQEILFFWDTVRSFALPNSELFKTATAKIADETKKLREEQDKLNKALQEEKEIRDVGKLEQEKLDVERKYIIKPQVSLNPIALTSEQKEEQEVGQIELKEINARRQTKARELADEEAAGRKGTAEYQKTVNEKEKLDQQYEARKKQLENKALQDQLNNIRQYVQQIDAALFKGLNEWILGQKTFKQAMIDAWNDIVRVVIQDIEKIAAKWIEEHIIMAAISKLLGIDDSSSAAAARIIAQNTAVEQSNAGRSATDVFIQAIESIPFPQNLVAAPILAHLAYAEAESAAHLDTGGYVPREGIAHLHQGEVVVNHPVTELLSNIADRGNAYYDQPQIVVPNANPNIFQSSSSQSSVGVSNSISNALASSSNNSSGDVHVHYAPTIHGSNNTPDLKKLLSEHADHIGRIVSRQSKSFNR